MALAGYTVEYNPLVVRSDIPVLDAFWRSAVKSAIEAKLMTQPDMYGLPLRQSLKGLWKLRVGDYRVVYRIAGKRVIVFAILNRALVYSETQKRTRTHLKNNHGNKSV